MEHAWKACVPARAPWVRHVIRRGALSNARANPNLNDYMYYVYFLKLNNFQIYTGLTRDLRRRYGEHCHGKVASTAKRRPVELIGYEAYRRHSDADAEKDF